MQKTHHSTARALRALLMTLGIACTLQPTSVFAGLKEGQAAYKKGDFALAAKEFKPLAQQGNPKAQYKLGILYTTGQGVRQDYQEAIKWFRLSLEQGESGGQNNLGAMYESGYGVKANRVAAYALYNLSHDVDSAKDNPAFTNRSRIAKTMSKKEIEDAQSLTREMLKPRNRLKALDQYIKQREQDAAKDTKDSKDSKDSKESKSDKSTKSSKVDKAEKTDKPSKSGN